MKITHNIDKVIAALKNGIKEVVLEGEDIDLVFGSKT